MAVFVFVSAIFITFSSGNIGHQGKKLGRTKILRLSLKQEVSGNLPKRTPVLMTIGNEKLWILFCIWVFILASLGLSLSSRSSKAGTDILVKFRKLVKCPKERCWDAIGCVQTWQRLLLLFSCFLLRSLHKTISRMASSIFWTTGSITAIKDSNKLQILLDAPCPLSPTKMALIHAV